MKYCRTCNKKNEDSATACKYCGGVFFSRIIEDKSTPASTDIIICCKCKKQYSVNQLFCPLCGTSAEESRREGIIKRQLKLRTKKGGYIVLRDGDILGKKTYGGESVFVGDLYVSDEHLKINQRGKFFELHDISEGNSFILNNKMIAVGGSAIVDTGDVIKVGVTDLYVTVLK